MKKTLILIGIIIAIIAIAVAVFYQPSPAGITLFYGQECPHCARVEQYIINNKIDAQVKITRKEVYHNESNLAEMVKIAKRCNMDTNNLGVPLIYDNKSCYSGEDQAYEFLKQFIK